MNERQYREHWATLTGRPVREVYVPVALREKGPEPSLGAVQEMLDSLSNDDLRQMVLDRTYGPRTDEEDGA